MKAVLFAVAAIFATVTGASAQYTGYQGYGGYGTGSNPSSVYHQGYTTPRGTYVQPHYQTAPDRTQFDNYGSRGNLNPYTGHTGTRAPKW